MCVKERVRDYLADMVIRWNLKLRTTAKNINKQLFSLRKALAILWLRRLTSPNRRSMTLLVRIVFQCALGKA